MLEREVNTDLLYQVQKELRGYAIYSDSDIDVFADEYFENTKQDSRAMGRMTSALKPVADRYNNLTADERYQFRRLCRNMKKWYEYISQVVRMFDVELHKEYVFLSYLLGLLPADVAAMIDLEGKLQLEYYKLQKTFDGTIDLREETGVYSPASAKGAVKPEEKQPLDEIIDKINEQYGGSFTEADRVMLGSIVHSMMANERTCKLVRSSDPQIFMDSILPKLFGDIAMDSYMDAETRHSDMQNAFKSMFEDKAKYNAIMRAVGTIVYRDMRRGRKQDAL